MAPPHKLALCVGDICYLLQTVYGEANKVSIRYQLQQFIKTKSYYVYYFQTGNEQESSHLILALNLRSIKIQTIELDDSPGRRSTLHSTNQIQIYPTLLESISYELTRMQYPLMLTYPVTLLNELKILIFIKSAYPYK